MEQPTRVAKGPYLQAAFFCERLLEEADGVMSAIRIVDTITTHGDGIVVGEVFDTFSRKLHADDSFRWRRRSRHHDHHADCHDSGRGRRLLVRRLSRRATRHAIATSCRDPKTKLADRPSIMSLEPVIVTGLPAARFQGVAATKYIDATSCSVRRASSRVTTPAESSTKKWARSRVRRIASRFAVRSTSKVAGTNQA